MRFGRYLGLKHEDTLERAGKAGRLQAEQASSRDDPKSFEKFFVERKQLAVSVAQTILFVVFGSSRALKPIQSSWSEIC